MTLESVTLNNPIIKNLLIKVKKNWWIGLYNEDLISEVLTKGNIAGIKTQQKEQ